MTVFDEGQQQFWREHGYMVVRDVVPAPLLEAVKQNIEEFLGKDLSDPDDWYNLAADPKPGHEQVMAGLRKWFPAREAPQVADMRSSKEQE